MNIIASQYNAMYTISIKDAVYIRQFSKFDDIKTEDQIVWYKEDKIEGDNYMAQIDDQELVDKLEKEFISILE